MWYIDAPGEKNIPVDHDLSGSHGIPSRIDHVTFCLKYYLECYLLFDHNPQKISWSF